MQTVTPIGDAKDRSGLAGPVNFRPQKKRAGRWQRRFTPYSFVLPIVLFTLLFLAYPVIYSVALSFRDATIDTFVSPSFWRALLNTVLFTFFSILFQFTIGFLLALFFQNEFPLKNALIALLLVPWLAPILTAANTFKGLFNEVGPINQIGHLFGLPNLPWLADPQLAFLAIIIANIWIGFPFNFILLYAGMRAVPLEIYEAAKLDGAAYWKQVTHITIPMLKPVTVSVLMLGTIYTVKVFDLVWIMTGGGPANSTHLLSTYAYQTGFSVFNFGQAAAIATVMVLLIVSLNLLQLALQRK